MGGELGPCHCGAEGSLLPGSGRVAMRPGHGLSHVHALDFECPGRSAETPSMTTVATWKGQSWWLRAGEPRGEAVPCTHAALFLPQCPAQFLSLTSVPALLNAV